METVIPGHLVAPGFLYIQAGGDVRVVITYLIEIGELLSLIFYAH